MTTGIYTDNGRPLRSSTLTPFLAIPDARGALEFYRDVFGASVQGVTEMGGIIVHADVVFPFGGMQIGEPNAEYHLVAPPAGEDDCYSIGIYVPDVDAVFEAAVAAGAQVREAPSTFVSGDRFASVRDPFGVRWSIMTRIEDISDEESARRVEEWAASFT
ncbi:VOC family protein [Microbacterium keratanolyticum]